MIKNIFCKNEVFTKWSFAQIKNNYMSLLYSSLFKLIDPDIISHSPKSKTYRLLKIY